MTQLLTGLLNWMQPERAGGSGREHTSNTLGLTRKWPRHYYRANGLRVNDTSQQGPDRSTQQRDLSRNLLLSRQPVVFPRIKPHLLISGRRLPAPDCQNDRC